MIKDLKIVVPVQYLKCTCTCMYAILYVCAQSFESYILVLYVQVYSCTCMCSIVSLLGNSVPVAKQQCPSTTSNNASTQVHVHVSLCLLVTLVDKQVRLVVDTRHGSRMASHVCVILFHSLENRPDQKVTWKLATKGELGRGGGGKVR